MKSLQIVVFGKQGAGKSTLLHRIEQDTYLEKKATIALDLMNIFLTDNSLKIQIYDLSGDKLYKEQTMSYLNNGQLILYCVDLSTTMKPKEIINDLRLFKTLNPKATLFLIGTKNDICHYETEHLLSHINSRAGNRFARTIITSAQTGEGRNELLDELINLSNAQSIHSERRRNKTYNINRYRLFTPKSYPDSYAILFPQHRQSDEELMRSARNLLNDYTKGGLFFFSTLSRLIHGHFNRHHIKRVTDLVRDIDQGRIGTPEALFAKFETINPTNHEGSLAQRINYIKKAIYAQKTPQELVPCSEA